MLRLGLCCCYHKTPIRFRTTTIAHTLKRLQQGSDPKEHLGALIAANCESLLQTLDFFYEHDMSAFRINSGFFPIYTNTQYPYTLQELPNYPELKTIFTKIRQRAATQNVRFSLHPDQFVVLNSPRESVVHSALQELEYHGLLADLVGADVINIHGGGGYGNKPSALKRLAKNFHRLSPTVQNKLTLENDDRVYTPSDLIPLCHDLGIPFVYDVHHHRCLPDEQSITEATKNTLTTWKREPLFHISSPKQGWNHPQVRSHHDYINIQDFPLEWFQIPALTVDVEAKHKELAIKKLKYDLATRGYTTH